jgi:peptide chain release factor subunit 1
MFNENDLRELLDSDTTDPVLSVYLNTDPTMGNADAYKLRLRNLLKEVELEEDVEAVERYINTEYDWSGRGIAIFSCSNNDFFRAYPLAIPVHDMVQAGNAPAIKPLANLIEAYGGYGVVLVDKQGARLFSFHLGELKEQEGVLGDSVKRMKRGGASSMGGRRGGGGKARAMDETIERNMRDAAEFTVKFFEENNVRRVLIGGTDDNVALFRGLLPKAWQSLVVGTFASSMAASHAEVQAKALEIGHEADKKQEKHLIDRLITSAAKGQGGVIGLEKSLAAITSGRVQVLVLIENYHEPGYHCSECGIMTTLPEEHCTGCGEVVEKVQDIVESAIAATLRSGGEVEVIHHSAALEGEQKIGALLRY